MPESESVCLMPDCLTLPCGAGVVKMRRGQVATFMQQVRSMKDVYQAFHQFATMIAAK